MSDQKHFSGVNLRENVRENTTTTTTLNCQELIAI